MSTTILHLHLGLALLLFAVLLLGRIPRLRVFAAIVALLVLVTGLHNFATRMQSPPPGWHMWIGIKALLGFHVIAIVLLSTRDAATREKLARWRKGALVSGAIAIVIGVYFSNFAR